MDLIEAREAIDRIDKELVRLIEKRLELVTAIGEYKKSHQLSARDLLREKKVLERINTLIENPVFNEPTTKIFQEIMKITKDYQQNEIIGK